MQDRQPEQVQRSAGTGPWSTVSPDLCNNVVQECKVVSVPQCSTVQEQVCNTVEDTECSNKTEQKCETVQERQCQPVQEDQCQTVNKVSREAVLSPRYLRSFDRRNVVKCRRSSASTPASWSARPSRRRCVRTPPGSSARLSTRGSVRPSRRGWVAGGTEGENVMSIFLAMHHRQRGGVRHCH